MTALQDELSAPDLRASNGHSHFGAERESSSEDDADEDEMEHLRHMSVRTGGAARVHRQCLCVHHAISSCSLADRYPSPASGHVD